MRESTLPIWALFLIMGVVINAIVGMANPYVKKESQQTAIRYKKNGAIGPKPTVAIYCRMSGFAYVCITAIVVLAASIIFFMESFIGLVEAMSGGVLGSLIALAMYAVGAVIATLVLLSAAVTGEMIEYDSLFRYYINRYDIKVEDRRDEIEPKTPH